MALRPLRKLLPAAIWTGILVAGVVAGWFGHEARRDRILAGLIENARRSAVAFEPTVTRQLTGARADLATPVYAAVKARLQRLRDVDATVRFVYLFRFVPETGNVIFLADSAPPGAKDESAPGEIYPQAPQSPGLQGILRTGQPATEGPLRDGFGTWTTGYALVDERPSATSPALTRDVLGVDIDATHWTRDLWLAGLQSAGTVWLLLGLPFAAWRISRREIEQREIIRNLSEAMEQSHSALMICDLESRIEYANRGLCQQIGYSRRDLIGRNWRDFRVADPTDETVANLVATVRAGRVWEGEWSNRRKDGTVYPVRGVVSPVKQRDGSLACFVAVFDDVTEGKRREAELREARDRAEAGDRAKSQFLATMSHEVRTPLNGIVGFTSLLLDTNLAPEQRECVQTIRASGETLIQLTSAVLDFARIESGKMQLAPAPCDPRECVEDALELVAVKAAEKNLELLHRVAADVPAMVIADGRRLRQILGNLIGNAVKFTEHGEVAVRVRRSPATEPLDPAKPAGECTLEFSVQDTGIGIPANEHAKLFRPFSQVDESSTRRYGGTGLGLAVARNLARLMDGEIVLVSEPGRGSTFTLTIRTPVGTAESPRRDLGRLRLGLAARPGAFRRELSDLATRWGAAVEAADTPAALAAKAWEIALVDLDPVLAQALAEQAAPMAGLAPEKTFGLVPISLSSELRHALRTHFRLLINKPVRHETLFATLSAASPRLPQPATPQG